MQIRPVSIAILIGISFGAAAFCGYQAAIVDNASPPTPALARPVIKGIASLVPTKGQTMTLSEELDAIRRMEPLCNESEEGFPCWSPSIRRAVLCMETNAGNSCDEALRIRLRSTEEHKSLERELRVFSQWRSAVSAERLYRRLRALKICKDVGEDLCWQECRLPSSPPSELERSVNDFRLLAQNLEDDDVAHLIRLEPSSDGTWKHAFVPFSADGLVRKIRESVARQCLPALERIKKMVEVGSGKISLEEIESAISLHQNRLSLIDDMPGDHL